MKHFVRKTLRSHSEQRQVVLDYNCPFQKQIFQLQGREGLQGFQGEDKAVFWRFLDITQCESESPFELADQRQSCIEKREAGSLLSALLLNSPLLAGFHQLRRGQLSPWLLSTTFPASLCEYHPGRLPSSEGSNDQWTGKDLDFFICPLFLQISSAG